MKRIINIDGKLYIENASSNVICQDGCLYAQDDRWITVHADKEAGIKGQHVLIKEDGTVIGGLGGKQYGRKQIYHCYAGAAGKRPGPAIQAYVYMAPRKHARYGLHAAGRPELL